MKKDLEEEFNTSMGILRELFDKNPAMVEKEVKRTVRKLNNVENIKKSRLIPEEQVEKIIFIVLFFILALLGLFNFSSYMLYIFGLIFFAAGLMVGTYENGAGIIFLFSHGITGLCIMIGSLVANVFMDPIMSDNPINIIIYFSIIVILCVIATFTAIIYNVSDKLKLMKNVVFLPLIIYMIAIFMAGVLSKFSYFIYSL